MRKTIFVTNLILLIFSCNFVFCATAESRSKKKPGSTFEITIPREELKTSLSTLITEPFDVEINGSNITIDFHTVILTTDQFLKNKLYSIASYLLSKNINPEVIVTVWQDLDTDSAYKAAVVKDDLADYNKGLISYNELFSRMKIVKSQLSSDETLKDALAETEKLHLSSSDLLVKTTDKPDLKPKIPPESFYTPILKPLIKADFSVKPDDNAVDVIVYKYPAEENRSIKEDAYKIMRSIMGVNPSLGKITVTWQASEGDFGKTASLAGIYIKDFFSKKITLEEMKEIILISTIEPTSRHLNEVSHIARLDVPIDNLRKGKELREAANIYRQNKKYDSALRTYKQAIEFNPNDFLSYYWMGEIYKETKDYDKARESLSKALGLNPEFRQADESLAQIKEKN